jgi:hypothetical protein
VVQDRQRSRMTLCPGDRRASARRHSEIERRQGLGSASPYPNYVGTEYDTGVRQNKFACVQKDVLVDAVLFLTNLHFQTLVGSSSGDPARSRILRKRNRIRAPNRQAVPGCRHPCAGDRRRRTLASAPRQPAVVRRPRDHDRSGGFGNGRTRCERQRDTSCAESARRHLDLGLRPRAGTLLRDGPVAPACGGRARRAVRSRGGACRSCGARASHARTCARRRGCAIARRS